MPLPISDSESTEESELFAHLLRTRRSIRSFKSESLSLERLGTLLVGAAAAQNVDIATGISYRSYPSGGGRYPLEIYVLPLRVSTLPDQLHYFDPFEKCLVSASPEPASNSWLAVRLREQHRIVMAGSPPAAVVLITSVFARTMWTYERIGLAMVYRDTGALLQTLYLQAAAIGLAGYAIGGGRHERLFEGVSMDPMEQGYVGAFAVGHPDVASPATSEVDFSDEEHNSEVIRKAAR